MTQNSRLYHCTSDNVWSTKTLNDVLPPGVLYGPPFIYLFTVHDLPRADKVCGTYNNR